MKNIPNVSQEAGCLANAAADKLHTHIYPESISIANDVVFAMVRDGTEKQLIVIADNAQKISDFAGVGHNMSLENTAVNIAICPLTHANALAVRKHLPFTAPITTGMQKTIGMGDRLGIATPGHVLAVKNSAMKPVFALQSIREMTRTKRTPDEVIDAACWGVLQAGYREGYGADADHLKNTKDIDVCFDSGYKYYTVDPGDHVDASADDVSADELAEKFAGLPWNALETRPTECLARYARDDIKLKASDGDFELPISREDVLRAAVKYGKAIVHVVTMYRHLQRLSGAGAFDYEISVDETATPTSVAEHYFVAAELKRLQVNWCSLAPRFVGDFEKGVDYIGDMDYFRSEFARHVAVAQHLGPYKMSLHSGSDKFRIYPTVAELAGDMVYLKTAGTSYLEALRSLTQVDPDLFLEILDFARQHYLQDKMTYHVSADLQKAVNPHNIDRDNPNDPGKNNLSAVLDQFDTRQVCHVTFGSVLTAESQNNGILFRDRILKSLKSDEKVYYQNLQDHLGKHIAPFR